MSELVLYRELTPTYPRIVVELHDRKTMSAGGLYVSDLETNKPIWEATVLKVYRPRHIKEGVIDGGIQALEALAENRLGLSDIGKWAQKTLDGYTRTVECDLQPGDHVWFHNSHGYATDPNEPKVALVQENHVLGFFRGAGGDLR